MKIINKYPPNIDEIDSKFHVRGKDIAYTYGDTVYIPMGGGLPDHVKFHENVHIKQQSVMGPEAWWRKYIDDSKFRLDQELQAYQAQYWFLKYGKRYDRNQRRAILMAISNDLSGPMYGHLLSPSMARELIQKGGEFLEEQTTKHYEDMRAELKI